jgi:hypothetical protein
MAVRKRKSKRSKSRKKFDRSKMVKDLETSTQQSIDRKGRGGGIFKDIELTIWSRPSYDEHEIDLVRRGSNESYI